MRWLLLLAGFLVASIGSAGAAALVTTARVALADAISRRLRGSDESLAWLATTEREVAAAIVATAFGVALVGAALPGVVTGATLLVLGVVLLLLVVPATLVIGYLLPRSLTVPRAERVVARLRPVLSGWSSVIKFVLPSRSADPGDDVRALSRQGAARGMGSHELVMVGGVISFAERPAREIMTPRTRVVAVSQEASQVEVLDAFEESGYTRLPVYRHTLDEIVGMVHAFDLFKHQSGDPLPLRPISFAPELRSCGDLLLEMQRKRQHLTAIVDEFGGTAGIVSLEDLLEALVGEISDEDEGERIPVTSSSDTLELDGSASPTVVAERFGVALPAGAAASFGGLLAELAGRIPSVGERFAITGLEVIIAQASPTRLERILVRRGMSHPIVLDRTGG